MKLLYVTLNTTKEAQAIGRELLENNCANCVNFFPITCMYKYKGEITQEPEVVLIIKTKGEKFSQIEAVIRKHITYDNFIGQLAVEKVNEAFSCWLNDVVGKSE